MEKFITAIREFLKLNARDRLVVALICGIVALYWWGKNGQDKAWDQQKEIGRLNNQIFQLQKDKEIQIVACEQRVYNVRVETDIKCQQQIQEIHKSYAESARQFKKSFDKHR